MSYTEGKAASRTCPQDFGCELGADERRPHLIPQSVAQLPDIVLASCKGARHNSCSATQTWRHLCAVEKCREQRLVKGFQRSKVNRKWGVSKGKDPWSNKKAGICIRQVKAEFSVES